MSFNNESLDLDDGRPMNRRAKRVQKSMGELHDLLTKKLPDFVDPNSGVCNLKTLAKARGITFQGVYKWFRNKKKNRVTYQLAEWLVDLSKKQTTGGPKFVPMTFDDIKRFIGKNEQA